jgi:hypothetical protein
MPRTSTVHAVTTIGIDMGKNTLHMVGLDKRGAIVLREGLTRTHRIEACETASIEKALKAALTPPKLGPTRR